MKVLTKYSEGHYGSYARGGDKITAEGNIIDPDRYFGELPTTTDLTDEDFSMFKATDVVYFDNVDADKLAENPIAQAAQVVHETTTPEEQSRIDEWFGAEDFGAVVVGELVNEDFRISELRSLNHKVKVAEAELAVAQGNLESALIELAAYKVDHEGWNQ